MVVLEKSAGQRGNPGSEGLRGGPISSIVYSVHKRIAKIMNAVHINT
jgi:hypothetical protein